MSDTDQDVKLKLSLLLDNRLAPEDHPELLEQLIHDRTLRTAWARYNMIGDAIRAPESGLAGEAFALRVSRAIEQEPPPVAVMPENTAPRTHGQPRELHRPPRESRRRPRANSRLGWALAASLAGFALVMGYNEPNSGLNNIDLVLEQNRGSVVQYPPEETAEARYNDYLMTHNEASYLTGSSGMLPHARLVSSPGR